MYYIKTYFDKLGVQVEATRFGTEDGVTEWHVMLHVDPRRETFEGQMRRIYEAEDLLPSLPEFADSRCILKRYFLSDSTNQVPLMRQEEGVSLSFIQQPPLDGSKIAVWLYLQRGTEVKAEEGMLVVSHNGYQHLWMMGLTRVEGKAGQDSESSAWQTEALLKDYEATLQRYGATLADNCIRTWFFVRDVDTQYAGMVRARRDNFTEQGLTSQTHYISSTGIGGGPADTKALIQLGTYALTGFEPGQQRYLYAPTHLNPTYEYGVTFERGTVMEFGDRAHVFISGTASINNRGEVVHVGDIVKQTERMWENVETLLKEGDAGFEDVMQIIVYLRDTADYAIVAEMFAQRFPQIPTVFTLAPVCRPAWLIEMECIAVRERNNAEFRSF